MGKARKNILEDTDYAVSKKRRGFKRGSKDQRYAEVEGLVGVAEEPPRASVLHIGNRLPKEINSENDGKENRGDSKEVQDEERKPMFRTGPTPETANRKPSHDISEEERITSLEDEIGAFGDGERRYVKKWVEIYPNELQQAIYKNEKKGEKITGKAVAAIRLSLINHIAKWGMDRGIAPEKSNLIEKYLELKLPHGIPPESPEELHLSEKEAIEKNEKERLRDKTDLFTKRAADAEQSEIDEKLPGKGTQVDESLKDLNKENKHMEIPVKEITNIREQLKQDKEELEKAKMYKNDADPHPGGKFEEDMRGQSKARQDVINDDKYFKKEKEPEFSPEELRAIRDIAHYISERRMAGESDEAKDWQGNLAKEYGLGENAFSKETIENIKLPNGKRIRDIEWTPEAEKFMQGWDWETAKEAFRNMKETKKNGQNGQVDTQQDQAKRIKAALDSHIQSGALDPGTPEEIYAKEKSKEEPFYPLVVSKSGAEREAFSTEPEVYHAEPIPREPELKALEDKSEKTLEELKENLDAKADAYATARGNAKGSRGFLTKLLGLSRKGFSENVEKTEEVKSARSEYLQAKLEHSKAASESAFQEYQDKLQGEKASPEELETLKIKLEAISAYHNRASDIGLQRKFVDKTVEYYKTKGRFLGKAFGKYLDFYNNVYLKKVPAKVRAAISFVMMGGAVASIAGAFGDTGEFLGAAAVAGRTARLFLAPLFPAMTYTGTGKMMEKGLQFLNARKGKKRAAAFSEVVGKMKSGEVSVDDTRKSILELLEKDNQEYGDDLMKRGWTEDRCEQLRNGLTMFVGARATMVLMSGTETISSFFGNKGDMIGATQSAPKASLYTQGSGGKKTITPEGMRTIENSSPGSAKLSPEEYEQIRGHSYFAEPGHGSSDVSHGGAVGAAGENALKKPQMPHETVKHGAVGAEHHPVRGATQVPQEVEIKPIGPRLDESSLHQAEHQPVRGGHVRAAQELTPQQRMAQIAQADQELAARHPGEVAANANELAKINHQVYLANRPLLGNVFHKFGVSNYYDIYDQPMNKWDDLIGTGPNIAQDVSQADAINTSNEAWKQLNDLKGMLKYYNPNGSRTIGECLRLALADQRVGVSGRGASIGALVQRAINEILNNKK